MPSHKTTQHADADAFTAIAHPVRRKILDSLIQGDLTVTQLADPFAVTRSAISQHLGILLQSGWVEMEKRGRENYYRLRPENLNKIQAWISKYEKLWPEKLDALGEYLNRLAAEEENDAE